MSLTPWTYTEFMTPALQCRRFMLDESTKRFFNEKREWRALPLVSTLVWKRPGEAHSPVDHSNTWRSLPLTSTGEWNVHLSFCSAGIMFKACCPHFHPLANWMYTVREIKLCFSSSFFFFWGQLSQRMSSFFVIKLTRRWLFDFDVFQVRNLFGRSQTKWPQREFSSGVHGSSFILFSSWSSRPIS